MWKIVSRALRLPFLGKARSWWGEEEMGWLAIDNIFLDSSFVCLFVWGSLPDEITSAPPRCRWRSGSGCGSSAVRSVRGSAAGSAAQTAVRWQTQRKRPTFTWLEFFQPELQFVIPPSRPLGIKRDGRFSRRTFTFETLTFQRSPRLLTSLRD